MKLSLRIVLAGGALALAAACAQDRNAAVADMSALTSACGEDCSKATDIPCFKGTCDAASGTCVVVPADDGTSCDDGQFCTVGDRCLSGVCTPAGPNPCGATDCLQGICNEDTDSCLLTQRPDGLPCKFPDNLCIVNALCSAGACVGALNDCRFADGVDECNNGVCDPKTGECSTIAGNDGAACHEDGQCTDAQTCFKGKCQGGVSRTTGYFVDDPTACHELLCNPVDGTLAVTPIPIGAACPTGAFECMKGTCATGGVCATSIDVGAPCTSQTDDCSFASCSIEGICSPSAKNEGQGCDDRDACTMAETCQSGTCKGALRPGVEIYWREDFSDLAAGWTSSTPPNTFVGANFGPVDARLLSANNGPFLPLRDHTPTMDSEMLGTILGTPGASIDSPIIDVSKATGNLSLTLWSALTLDATTSAVISVFDGTAWQEIWNSPYLGVTTEWVFTPIVVDVTKFKNPKFKLRLKIANGGDISRPAGAATWFVDDFTLANRDCAVAPVPGGGGNGG